MFDRLTCDTVNLGVLHCTYDLIKLAEINVFILLFFSSVTGFTRANHVSWIFSDNMITIMMVVSHANSSLMDSLPPVSLE